MNIIEVKDLTLSYDKIIFENLNLSIKRGKINTILMKNSSGKTTLSKILKGKIKYDYIYLNKTPYNKINKMYKDYKIALISKSIYQTNKVLYELSIPQELMHIPPKQIQINILNLAMILDMVELLNLNPKDLKEEDKIKVDLALKLIYDPDILIIDDRLNNLYNKKLIFGILNNLKKQGLTIIYLTSNSEDLVYADYIYMIEKKVICEGNREDVLKNPDNFKKIKITMPFMLELSTKLKYYNLINKIYFSEKKLVDDLWRSQKE